MNSNITEADYPNDEAARLTLRAIAGFVGMCMVALSLVIWSYAIRKGDYTLPYLPFGPGSTSYLIHKLSHAIVMWGPLAVVVSIFGAAHGLGNRRHGWFRQAFFIATLVVGCYAFWAMLAMLHRS